MRSAALVWSGDSDVEEFAAMRRKEIERGQAAVARLAATPIPTHSLCITHPFTDPHCCRYDQSREEHVKMLWRKKTTIRGQCRVLDTDDEGKSEITFYLL